MRPALRRGISLASRPWLAMEPKTSPRLRVLGYHDISDPARMRQQLAFVADHFQVLSQPEAIAFLEGDLVPNARPLWITFDDGDPSIVEPGLELLAEFSFSATMFVCPGLIDSTTPFWWQAIEHALNVGIELDGQPLPGNLVAELKTVPDRQRRAVVDRVMQQLERSAGRPAHHAQLTRAQMDEWLAAGNTVGNHTWDHPILDQTAEEEQERQIVEAHEHLSAVLGSPPVVFAYPNGNMTHYAASVLSRLGYRLGLLFDHRVASEDPWQATSRIRVNSDDHIDAFRGRVSGLHPAALRLRNRLTPRSS